MVHLRRFVLLVFFFPSGARGISVDGSHHGAQQQNNMFANELELSSESWDALIPGGAGTGFLRRSEGRLNYPASDARMKLTVRGPTEPKDVTVDPARMKLIKAGIPVALASRISFQTGGARVAGQEDEILILWKEVQKCYPTKEKALEAVTKNSPIILPQFNSPRKIKGTYAQLRQRFGKSVAQEIVEKNPGILVSTPEGLSKITDEAIVSSANFVDSLEKNKPVILKIARLFQFSILGAFVYGIATYNFP